MPKTKGYWQSSKRYFINFFSSLKRSCIVKVWLKTLYMDSLPSHPMNFAKQIHNCQANPFDHISHEFHMNFTTIQWIAITVESFRKAFNANTNATQFVINVNVYCLATSTNTKRIKFRCEFCHCKALNFDHNGAYQLMISTLTFAPNDKYSQFFMLHTRSTLARAPNLII